MAFASGVRIPLNKIYRAFGELDRFDDDQCRLLMRRGHLELAGTLLIWVVVGVVFVLCVVLVATLVAVADLPQWAEQFFRDGDILLWLLCLLVIPTAAGLLTRDRLLRRLLVRAIRLRIDRVRCRRCKYILIGQRPSGDLVACPECGGTNLLSDLGVTEADLIPPVSDLEMLSSEAHPSREGA